jgi:hypothetical protein
MRFLPRKSKQVDCAPLMNGVRVATLVVGMMVLASRGASAQSSFMCADQGRDAADDAGQQGSASLDELDAPRLVHAPLVASLVDSPVDSLVDSPLDNSALPWCTNQSDPQCSKRPAGSVPSLISIGASSIFALSVPLARPSLFSIECDFAEYSCGGPRDAMRSKLERPPE